MAIEAEEEEDQTRTLRPKRERTVKSFAGLFEDEEDEEEAPAATQPGAAPQKDEEEDDDDEFAGPKSKRRKLNEAPTWRRDAGSAAPAATANKPSTAVAERDDGFEEAPDDEDD